jgi:gamma-glutamyltranspeptidase/glutathione hydrolase
MPPTQGAVSLLILGMLDQLRVRKTGPSSPEFVHLCVEAAKQAFAVRDRYIEDPRYMTIDAQRLLDRSFVHGLASKVRRRRAAAWGSIDTAGKGPGDTVWLGVIDDQADTARPHTDFMDVVVRNNRHARLAFGSM